jgi:tetratricopeptide (TPR) repeat protein
MAQILSVKEQLIMSKKVKYSAEKAVELNPNNDIAWHIIGKWHFRISELSWFEKTMANVIFGGIPKDASFEVAKYSFEKALTIKPNSIAHHVELAKTLIELDQDDKAKLLLEKVLTLNASESNDPEYLEEAKKILKKL